MGSENTHMEPEIAVVSAEKLMLVKTVLLKIELQKEKNSKTNTMGGEIRAPQRILTWTPRKSALES
jgi:hypothetical protein